MHEIDSPPQVDIVRVHLQQLLGVSLPRVLQLEQQVVVGGHQRPGQEDIISLNRQ